MVGLIMFVVNRMVGDSVCTSARSVVKPHKEDDCFVLHPEKRPKSWGTPPGKGKGRGRYRPKGKERERSRSKSGERRGEKSKGNRFPSPYPRAKADRVTEESEDEEKRDERI